MSTTTRTLTAALVLAAAATAGCARNPNVDATTTTGTEVTSRAPHRMSQPANPSTTATSDVPVPGGASLEDSATAAEFQAFPEEVQAAKRTGKQVEHAMMASATDRTYRTNQSYSDVVGFYDRALQGSGYTVEHRGSTAESTSWRLRCPDGTYGRVIVRKTTPTTFEVVTAEGEAARSN
jgi:hypothetical protein